MSARKNIAPPATHNTALLGVDKIVNILSVHERFVNITAILETIKVINDIARTSFAAYPRRSPKRYTTRVMIRMPTPCRQLNNILCNPKKGSSILFGGRFITFFSSFSASKMIEHAGSMINSRKTICTGHKIKGKLPNNIGNKDNPAMGT